LKMEYRFWFIFISILYKFNFEDSAWGFELSATNLFDIEFKRQNSVNEFIVADRRLFIQPRIVMCKVIYKL
jgi:hypothetical protein